jgi:branched-subunit amino acid aminotransferase/4-amino-4-deoxychorismate lyase
VDGRLAGVAEAVVRVDDSAFAEGRGAYSSARVERGRVRFLERHVARLVRAASELRLPALDPELARRGFRELAAAAFGASPGVVRLQVSRDGDGALHVVGVPRPLGPEPSQWSAVLFHPGRTGPGAAPGLKATGRLELALAREAAASAGADEALLVDGLGRLLEGARSNVVVVGGDGAAATPPVWLGLVAGIARDVALERVPGIEEREIPQAELRVAREIVALNAVRGARPITRLDGAPVGDGGAGAWAQRLAAALAED